MKVIIYISLMLSFVSCSETRDLICYSFDEKQCLFDPWSATGLDENKEDDIKSYLSTEGIEIDEIYIDRTFHEVACAACEICPSGPRIYIAIEDQFEAKLTTLSLLSLSNTDCSNIP